MMLASISLGLLSIYLPATTCGGASPFHAVTGEPSGMTAVGKLCSDDAESGLR